MHKISHTIRCMCSQIGRITISTVIVSYTCIRVMARLVGPSLLVVLRCQLCVNTDRSCVTRAHHILSACTSRQPVHQHGLVYHLLSYIKLVYNLFFINFKSPYKWTPHLFFQSAPAKKSWFKCDISIKISCYHIIHANTTSRKFIAFMYLVIHVIQFL